MNRRDNGEFAPYGAEIKINKANQIYKSGKYIGYIDNIENWGTNWLPRPEGKASGPFFKTKTEAVKHLISQHE